MKHHRNNILAALSGILLVLSHPSFNLFPLAWIGLVPLLIAVTSAPNAKLAFKLGYISGLTFFGGLIYWIVLLYPFANIFVTVLGYVALVAYAALYFAVFALFVHQLPRKSGMSFIFPAALFWTGLEWIRSWLLTGFPWGSMGYSQWNNVAAIQIASITGVYGVSFVVVLFNAAIAYFVISWSNRLRAIKGVAFPFAIAALSFAYGAFCLSDSGSANGSVKLGLVPGHIPQAEKWKSEHAPRIFNRYLGLTEKANAENLDLVVWPETSIHPQISSGRAKAYKIRLSEALRNGEIYLLAGTAVREADNKVYNSVLLLSPEGENLGSYSKMHLVPFGEYVPFSSALPNFIQFETFAPGKSINLLPLADIEDAEMGIAICFESVFPDLFRKFVAKGANIMGILTNDSWFVGTTAPAQHLSAAPFRAVENRIPVFRCANGGFSCIIDPFGRIASLTITPSQLDGVLVEDVPLKNHQSAGITLYTRYGDWFPILCLLVSLALIGHRNRNWVQSKLRRAA
ncbi:MAG: apolipoprotein N-acyltransferase [Candidatus Poribacteria bacterium]|nr:apolipoprotein N-acyltransferase [Candidatus Poribacteria bacterium]MDE0502566.1 apolipoprotein N-acyltransferase [Candidatus Poribacteria bacterium]